MLAAAAGTGRAGAAGRRRCAWRLVGRRRGATSPPLTVGEHLLGVAVVTHVVMVRRGATTAAVAIREHLLGGTVATVADVQRLLSGGGPGTAVAVGECLLGGCATTTVTVGECLLGGSRGGSVVVCRRLGRFSHCTDGDGDGGSVGLLAVTQK